MTTSRPFEIGLFTFGEITADSITGRPINPAVRLREFVQLAEVGDQAGLDVFGVGEHQLLGNDRFLAQMGLGGLPFAETARSIELLATEVLPVVRRETSGKTKGVA